MALTPPTYMDYGTFRNETVAAGEQAFVTLLLQQATDAVWVNTGLEQYPADERAARITRNAIMDFALWLSTQADHKDEINSPFSTERIGSYSYSKMQQARRGEETGIYWLDMLFTLMRMPGTEGESAWVSSERVFNPTGETYEEMTLRERAESIHDPSLRYWSL